MFLSHSNTLHYLKGMGNLQPINIVAAFRGMHVSPAKHSYAWLSRKCDYLTNARQSDPYVPLCFAGDTKRGHKVVELEVWTTKATKSWHWNRILTSTPFRCRIRLLFLYNNFLLRPASSASRLHLCHHLLLFLLLLPSTSGRSYLLFLLHLLFLLLPLLGVASSTTSCFFGLPLPLNTFVVVS